MDSPYSSFQVFAVPNQAQEIMNGENKSSGVLVALSGSQISFFETQMRVEQPQSKPGSVRATGQRSEQVFRLFTAMRKEPLSPGSRLPSLGTGCNQEPVRVSRFRRRDWRDRGAAVRPRPGLPRVLV